MTLFGGLSSASAAINSWIVASGTWTTGSNWSTGAVAGQFTGTSVINNSGTALIGTGVIAEAWDVLTGTAASTKGTILISSGGQYTVNEVLALGSHSGTGTLLMTGGKFIGGDLEVGGYIMGVTQFAGVGVVNVTGGTLTPAHTYIGYTAGSSGTATISSGTWNMSRYNYEGFVGDYGYGILQVTGSNATVSAQTLSVGEMSSGTGVIAISSGTFKVADNISVGNVGTGTVAITGGIMSNGRTSIGDAGGQGAITVNGGTFNSTQYVSIGNSGTGSLLVSNSNSVVTTGSMNVGAGKLGSVTMNGGTLTTASVTVGLSGTGSLSVSGGIFSGSTTIIGSATTSHGVLTVSGGTLATTTGFTVGALGSSNQATIQSGGQVTSVSAVIGTGTNSSASAGSSNDITIKDAGSEWILSGTLTVGINGSHNTVTVEDGGLVEAAGIAFSTGIGTSNTLRIHDGYFALMGDQTAFVSSTLQANSDIQIWNGSIWVTATVGNPDFYATYYSTDADAFAATGYHGLGDTTILTSTIPEPATCALAGFGLVALWASRRGKSDDEAAETGPDSSLLG